MSILSYAQNFEDVVLHRALKHIENGFYVDVGAYDPVVDSVTKSFYEAGWQGINIEPVAAMHEKLCQDRPRDLNLQVAVGDCEGEVEFHEIVGTGLSTMDKSNAKKHVRESGYEMNSYKVPITTLSAIFDEHVDRQVHFLKIDVEGAEKDVLKGLDFGANRPWIVLVESTEPNSRITSHENWETILLEAGYDFAYFDGLNRFYVADEHRELMELLSIPPNVFDDFRLSGYSNSPLHYQISAIESTIAELRANEKNLLQARQKAELRQQHLQSQLEEAMQEATASLADYKLEVENLEKFVDDLQEQSESRLRSLHETRAQLKDNVIFCRQLESELEHTKGKCTQIQEENQSWRLEVERVNEELSAIYNSKSWQITLPLRLLWKPFGKKHVSKQ